MHELAVTRDILAIVLRYARTNDVEQVVTVRLKVGALSDLVDEWVQSYFDHLSEDTVAQGARLEVERIEAGIECEDCGAKFEADVRRDEIVTCPKCGKDRCRLVSGWEYFVESMEVR